MTVDDDERLARLALARVAEPGSHDVHLALQQAPAAEVWASVKAGAPLGQLGQRALDGIAGRVDGYVPERDLERLGDLGGRVICPGDDEWPDGLDWGLGVMQGDVKGMAPPWVLLVRGRHDLRKATATSVAIVGARAATAYGTHVAGELAFALAEAGTAVVSGAAYGIDGAAHRGALTARAAPTIAVLACGLDIAYPRGHDRLLAQVAESGLIVSEVPPGCAPTRVRFLVRNRVVAALTRGTVVVEAALRSGSLSTANRALDLGRKVLAVPGPVTSAQSAGCHEWIRTQRAVLVTDAAEVLEVVGAAGEHLLLPKRGAAHPRDALDETVRRVLDAVPVRTAVGVARIARTAGVPALVVQQVLPSLLVAGLVEQRDGAWRLTTLGAAAPAQAMSVAP
ncbi:MAG: dna polymerase sliding clamp subunit [Frankiales bacterium]|nr:dna polymerase sliding clamp subunit [Frankiales bacterium]